MKSITRIALLVACTVFTLLLELPLAPEAEAFVRGRRMARRTAIVVVGVSSANRRAQSEQEAAAANQRAAEADREAAEARAEAEAANQRAAAAQAAAPGPAGAQPIGRVVDTLPEGCRTTTISGVEYHHCGADYYLAAFQSGQLVYVTTTP